MKIAANTRYQTAFWLLIIVLLGLFLRLYKLDYKSMWIDELYSVVPTNPQNDISFIIDYCKSDQPPVYFLLLHGWFKIFGYTSYFARLFSVFCGILGIVSVFFLGKEIINEKVGLLAGFLCSINYFHIYYSQEARFYALLFLLTNVSFIFFVRCLKKGSLVNYGLYVLATVSLLYTQYFGIIVFAIQGFVFCLFTLFFAERPRLRLLVEGVVMAAIVIAAFIPWIPVVIHDSQIGAFWIEKPKPYFLAVYYYIYWGKDVFLGVLLLAAALFYLWHMYRSFKGNDLTRWQIFMVVLLASWVILSYLLPYVRSIIATPMLIPRYTIIALAPIFLVMAAGVTFLPRVQWIRAVVFVALISTMLNLFFIQRHYTAIDKCQWRESAQAVIDHYKPGTKVYSNQEWWYNFYFYFTEQHIKVLGKFSSDEEAELQPFIDLIGSDDQFWVLSGETENGLNRSQQAYTDEHFKIKDVFRYYAASAILYEKK